MIARYVLELDVDAVRAAIRATGGAVRLALFCMRFLEEQDVMAPHNLKNCVGSEGTSLVADDFA